MKFLRLLLLFILVSGVGLSAFGQSTINITTSGGSYAGEKWVSITTAVNGGGTQVWGQGDGTYSNGAGLINQDISIAPGTYYVNCYDQYSDGWDGTLISVTAYGSVIGNNGGASPSDPATIDASSSWEPPGTTELEASFQIIVPAPPSCIAPTNLGVSALTATTATATWDVEATATNGYNWEVVPSGDGQGVNVVASGSVGAGVTSASVTGLTANTSYDLYVQSDCGGNGTEWSSAYTFYTGHCQVVSTNTGSYINNFTTTNGSTNISNTSSGYATDGYEDATAMVVSQYEGASVDFSAGFVGTTVGFNIWIDWNNDLDFDDAGEDVYASGTYVSSASGTITVPASQPLGNYRMRIRCDYNSTNPNACGTSGSGRNETEDYTFTVTAVPSCLPAGNLGTSALTATTATATWDVEATATSGYNWEVVPSGDGQGVNVVVSGNVGVGVTSASVTGLTANTSYDLYVQSDCGGNGTAWSSAYTFTTLCAAVTDFSENFDGVTTPALPGCFQKSGTSGTLYTQTSNNNSSPNCLYIYSSSTSNKATVVLPEVTNIDAGTHRLRFQARGNFSSGAVLNIGYITDPNDAATFTSVTSVTIASTSYAEYVATLGVTPPSGSYLAIQHSGSPSNSTLIDDMVWEAIPLFPNCSVVSTPADASTDIAVTTNLSWAANFDATGYKLSIGTTTGGTDILNASDLGNVTSYDPPTDLVFGQTYYVTLIAYNANGDATSCTETSFTTTDGCVTATTPADASTDIGVLSSASWSAVTGATGYKVSIGTSAGGTDVVNASDNGNSTTYDMSGASLAYSTTYHITIVAYNANGDATGCSSTSFTTQADPTVTAPWMDDLESHDATTSGGSISTNGWSATPTSGFDWNITGTGTTPSSSTGANSAYSGNNYFYTEASDGSVNDIASLTTPPIDVSALTTPYLYFYYHMHGSVMGDLYIDVYNGTTWSNAIYTLSGEQQAAQADAWQQAAIDISSYGSTVTIRFRGTKAGSFYGDISIDDVEVDEAPATPPNCDAAMTSPADAATGVGTGATISWSAATGAATGYKIQIGTTMGGSEFLAQTDVGNVLTYDPASDFAFNTTYYVNITPYNAAGDASSGCTEYSFTTTDGCVTATTPADAATDVSATSSISWSALSDVAGYKVSIGTSSGGTDIVNATDNGTSTSYDMSGASLAYSTTYYITIVAYNDAGDATGCTSTSFTTMADPTVTPPYNESFEGTFLPTGWAMDKTSGNDWTQNTSSSNATDGTKSAKYSWNSSQAADSWLFTTPVALEAGKTYIWSFDQKVASSSYPENLKFTVGTAQTIAGQTTILYDGNGLINTSFEERTGNFTAPSTGTYYFAFQAYSAVNQYTIYVDNLNIEEACPAITVTSVVGHNAGTVSADMECTDSEGWTHYWNDATNQMVLSIKKNGNNIGTIGDGTFAVSTTDNGSATFYADGTGFITNGLGGVLMNRKWDVTPTTAPSSNVDVRFYYTAQNYTDVNTEITNQGGTALSAHTELNFFKVTSGEDPFVVADLSSSDIELILNGGSAGINTWTAGTFGSDFYAEYQVAGFSGGGGGGASGGAALPVELTSFTAVAEGTTNVLNWTTSSEENNAGFDVERSANGVDFETIGQVEGNGTTIEVSNYNFVDETPTTVSYYRLRQVDFDGNYEHSNVVVVKREAGNNNVMMFPIPVQDRLTVQYTAATDEEMTITVVDATGRTVVTKAITATQGENQFKLNLNELPSGSYFVRLQSENSNIIRTIVKQ